MRRLVLLALTVTSCANQDSTPLVNLGRLPIARVFSNSRGRGGPDAEKYYGVRSAFDAGTNIWNEINYTSWHAGPGRHGLEEGDVKSVDKQVNALGVSMGVCEPSGLTVAGAEGYEKYLEILPNGPQADDAWWNRRFRSCGDEGGTPEQDAELISWNSDFLKRFPASSHASEAQMQIREARLRHKQVLKGSPTYR